MQKRIAKRVSLIRVVLVLARADVVNVVFTNVDQWTTKVMAPKEEDEKKAVNCATL